MIKPIKCIDSPMGVGKTSAIIEMFNSQEQTKPFLFICPFLAEINRVLEACPTFVQPLANTEATKGDNLLELLRSGVNIASTHALFESITPEIMKAISVNEYVLVMDEVVTVLKKLKVHREDVMYMIEKGVLKVRPLPATSSVKAPDPSLIQKILPGKVSRLSQWPLPRTTETSKKPQIIVEDIQRWAEEDRLVILHDDVLMWLFPSDCIDCFSEVFVLTYRFKDSLMDYYFQIHGLEYEHCSVSGEKGAYEIGPYDEEADLAFREKTKELINLYVGKKNKIDEKWTAFCVNFWNGKDGAKAMKLTENAVRTFFLHSPNEDGVIPKTDDVMWTCFVSQKGTLKPTSFINAWTPFNLKAINDYGECWSVAYLVNRYTEGSIMQYFSAYGFHIDQRKLAVSELLQYLYRSRLRNGKSISLFMPSARMQALLRGWWDNNEQADESKPDTVPFKPKLVKMAA
jgi:hypothetical protein